MDSRTSTKNASAAAGEKPSVDTLRSFPFYEEGKVPRAQPAIGYKLIECPRDEIGLYPTNAITGVIDQMGADRVLFGSDFPYEIGDADCAIAVESLKIATVHTREVVLSGNARRLFGQSVAAS